MKRFQKYLFTAVVVLIAVAAVCFKYLNYIENPWTRNGQVSANVVEITPRVSGPIVKLTVKNDQLVSAGDLVRGSGDASARRCDDR